MNDDVKDIIAITIGIIAVIMIAPWVLFGVVRYTQIVFAVIFGGAS